MATIKSETISIPGTPVGSPSDLPLLHFPMAKRQEHKLPENEGLFLNYGRVRGALPYTEQGGYRRALPGESVDLNAVVLENERLRATFLPEVGGRLWSLKDKLTGRDLVVENTAFQPCNFAVRNAWVSGGIEWNFGVRGHSALTSEKVFVAPYTMADGSAAVRIYAFERIRAIAYQLDCFLRDDLPFLFVRVRIENATDAVKPVYWWSTTAVKQEEGARVIVPADSAYVNQGDRPLRIQEPLSLNGLDLTYPVNHKESLDHFYRVAADQRKFEAYVFSDGYGLMQTSTATLRGRKLFVWGNSAGGDTWQRFLTNRDGYSQPYAEVQAGLASTQEESLPMPPNTTWEWLEAYGAVQLDAAVAHGPWQEAKAGAEQWLEQKLPEQTLEEILVQTREDAKAGAQPKFCGEGWGALENALRSYQGRKAMSPHLDWGEMQPDQEYWYAFLQDGILPDSKHMDHLSYIVQDEWFLLLKQSAQRKGDSDWRVRYYLGLCYYARELYEEASESFTRSLERKRTKHALHGLAHAQRALGEMEAATRFLFEALQLDRRDQQLAKEALRTGLEAGRSEAVLQAYRTLPEDMKRVPMLWALAAAAHCSLGEHETADEMMTSENMQPPDLREGERFIIDAYIKNRIALAKLQGVELKEDDVDIPAGMDFRMFSTAE